MILGLSGGVGGARMLAGLQQAAGAESIACIVNVADDEAIYGLEISPDLDTVCYHLAHLTDWDRGWGIAGDTFNTMHRLGTLGSDAWFQLGDLDLATHLFRTTRRRSGDSLSAITAALCRQLGIRSTILPATDDPVRTRLVTEMGSIAFQEWFVRQRAAIPVTAVEYVGATEAQVLPAALELLASAERIVICPSNPFLSIDPMLAMPAFAQALEARREAVIVVSPLISGRAVRGPAAELFKWLGIAPSVSAIADRYAQLASHLVCDSADADEASALATRGWNVLSTDTLMRTPERAARLATAILDWQLQ